MKITKGRHLSILFAIMNHDGVVTSDDLADFSLSSARTVKSDIAELMMNYRKRKSLISYLHVPRVIILSPSIQLNI